MKITERTKREFRWGNGMMSPSGYVSETDYSLFINADRIKTPNQLREFAQFLIEVANKLDDKQV